LSTVVRRDRNNDGTGVGGRNTGFTATGRRFRCMSHGSEGIRGGPPPVERRGACGKVAAVLEIKTTGWKTVTMVVRGELDMRQAPALRAAITALLNRGDLTAIDLDLSDVAFIDSTGLGTIVVGHRIAADLGVTLQVTASSLFAARLLSLVGADAVVPAQHRTQTAR
jgi:anti-anti-sigma factor